MFDTFYLLQIRVCSTKTALNFKTAEHWHSLPRLAYLTKLKILNFEPPITFLKFSLAFHGPRNLYPKYDKSPMPRRKNKSKQTNKNDRQDDEKEGVRRQNGISSTTVGPTHC